MMVKVLSMARPWRMTFRIALAKDFSNVPDGGRPAGQVGTDTPATTNIRYPHLNTKSGNSVKFIYNIVYICFKIL